MITLKDTTQLRRLTMAIFTKVYTLTMINSDPGLKFPDVDTPIVRKSTSKMFPIVCLYAAGIDRREISELKTIGRHRVVRINQ